ADKMIRRHPHVFGEDRVDTAAEQRLRWEEMKAAERAARGEQEDRSALAGVPVGLPALTRAVKLQERAARVGFDWPDIEGPLEKLAEEVGELARAGGGPEREAEFGDVLFTLVNIADRLGVDAEQALRSANEKFRRRFGEVERLAKERGLELRELDLAALDRLWEEAKAGEG
ncbi:MAG: MazG family protein, partial [Tepidiforma sp.]